MWCNQPKNDSELDWNWSGSILKSGSQKVDPILGITADKHTPKLADSLVSITGEGGHQME